MINYIWTIKRHKISVIMNVKNVIADEFNICYIGNKFQHHTIQYSLNLCLYVAVRCMMSFPSLLLDMLNVVLHSLHLVSSNVLRFVIQHPIISYSIWWKYTWFGTVIVNGSNIEVKYDINIITLFQISGDKINEKRFVGFSISFKIY